MRLGRWSLDTLMRNYVTGVSVAGVLAAAWFDHRQDKKEQAHFSERFCIKIEEGHMDTFIQMLMPSLQSFMASAEQVRHCPT